MIAIGQAIPLVHIVVKTIYAIAQRVKAGNTLCVIQAAHFRILIKAVFLISELLGAWYGNAPNI